MPPAWVRARRAPLVTSRRRAARTRPTTLVVLDLVGIFVFAISGALVAVRKDLDVFGVLVLAGTTGLGGGFLRDVLIGATPPAALEDWRYLMVPVAAGLLTFCFHPALGRMERAVNVFDAFGLALFCVTGALKALDYGLGPLPAALMGMVTGIGGGMARDVLAGRVPAVFRGELYATPALAGAAIAVVGASTSTSPVGRGRHPRRRASAWSGGCSRSGGTGRRRCRPGPPASESVRRRVVSPTGSWKRLDDLLESSRGRRPTGVHAPPGTVHVSSSALDDCSDFDAASTTTVSLSIHSKAGREPVARQVESRPASPVESSYT